MKGILCGRTSQDRGGQLREAQPPAGTRLKCWQRNAYKCLAAQNPGSLDLLLILELPLFWEASRVLCQSAKKEAEL